MLTQWSQRTPLYAVVLTPLLFFCRPSFVVVRSSLPLRHSSVVCLLKQKDVASLGITCRTLQQVERGFTTGQQAFPLGCVSCKRDCLALLPGQLFCSVPPMQQASVF